MSLLIPRRSALNRDLQIQFKLKRKSRFNELISVIMILVVASIVIWKIVDILKLEKVSWAQAFTPILSLGVAILAYKQWLAARYEISIEKYYDRLESANKRHEILFTEKTDKLRMFVFTELDKLEYVIIKYELGYISEHLMNRAIKNFKGLCQDVEGFKNAAIEWVNRAAYLDQTKLVTNAIVGQV